MYFDHFTHPNILYDLHYRLAILTNGCSRVAIPELVIPHDMIADLLAQAESGAPAEICGLIGGRANQAERLIAIPNADSIPLTRYTMDRRAMVSALLAFERDGLEVVAIYHSHPNTENIPSMTDIALASWPDALYLIVNPALPTPIRAWQIRLGKVLEARIYVIDSL
jgi:proteasome lid subunit RPN8/RPN11